MRWLHRARRAISDLVGRRRFEREMNEELQGYLELEAGARERAGATPWDARRAARVSFGGVEACKESLRDLRFGAPLGSVAQDVRFSVRLLRRQPAFAAAAMLTIALGTFPLAATAGFANALFFHPAPGVTGADRLVRVEFITRDESGDIDRARLSYLNHADLISGMESLTGLAGRAEGSASITAPGIDAMHVDVDFVTHDFFDVLGMRLAAGRPFLPEEDGEPGGRPVVILGDGLARTLFGSPEIAPGRAVLVNGLDFLVVGVAPPEFRGLKNDHDSQMWMPGATFPYANHSPRERWVRDRGDGLFEEFVGRLTTGVNIEQVRAELTIAARALADAFPAENRHFLTADVNVERQPGMSFSGGNTRGEVALMVTMFAAAGALILLLAGANVGNLMLFLGARRRDEMAIRSALGASRWRLQRANLIDVSLISLAGGALGLGLTWGVARLSEGFIVPDAGFLTLPIDWRVGGAVLAVALLIGLIFGGAPALLASSRGGVALTVRTPGRRAGRRLRNALTMMQLALSLCLLAGAMLLLATVRNLLSVDLGFDPAPVASASLSPDLNGYDDARSLEFYRELLARAASRPGVSAVSVSAGGAPIGRGGFRERLQLPGGDSRAAIAVAAKSVTTDYFRVLGRPLLRGRTFSQDEVFAAPDSACGPVIVSESLAVRLFGTPEVLDRTVVIARTRASMECRVVGVAADVRNSPDADWVPTLYRPLGREPLLLIRVSVLARSHGPLPVASAALRETVTSIDPAVPLHLARPLVEEIEFQLAGRRILASVLAFLALLGLTMAAVGLYGLVSEAVGARMRELAVRLAVGAGPQTILFSVLGDATKLAGIGIAAGIVLAAGLSRAMRSQLFGVAALEPWVYLSAAGLLATAVLIASLVPAVRATRVNPVEVLRAE